MKNIYYTIVYLGSILALVSCAGSKNASQTEPANNGSWQETPLYINGDDGDWSQALAYSDAKLEMNYSVSNDLENLYIRLITGNNETISRILYGGLTLYLNNHGVKDIAGAAGISFPTGNMKNHKGNLLNDRAEYRQNKRVAVNAVQDYSLFGFPSVKTQENYDLSNENPEGIRLGIGLNNAGALVYEAKIPLVSFLSKNDIMLAGRKSFAVGWIIDPLPPGMNNRAGGGGISIGGGIGMGSFGGGSGMGISIGSGALGRIGGGGKGKQVKIWKEMVLAKPFVNK